MAAPITYGLSGYYLGSQYVTAATPGAVFHAAGSAVGLTLPNQQNSIFNREGTGWTTRANIALDLASNTAYGPLLGHIEIQEENGNGLDNTGTSTGPNLAYLTWRASPPVRRLRSSRSSAAATTGRTSLRPTARALTSLTSSPIRRRSAAASRQRSRPKARVGLERPGTQMTGASGFNNGPLRTPQTRATSPSADSVGPTSSALCTSRKGGARPRFPASFTTST